MVICLGIPLDENVSFLAGSAQGPDKTREVYHSKSANYFSEQGIDLEHHPDWRDDGNIHLSGMPRSFSEIEEAIHLRLHEGHRVLSLGGDHSITYPIMKAYARRFPRLNVLHIDAHQDLYDEFEGNRLSHACPFARIMEEKLASRLVQVGIRTSTLHLSAQAKRFGVEVIEMKDWSDDIRFEFDGPVYISLDLDALDPAFVPGVSHHEPGGFSTREVLSIIRHLDADIVGADIVELNPVRDVNGVTAMTSAKFMKELLARMIK
jgi:agmatinase